MESFGRFCLIPRVDFVQGVQYSSCVNVTFVARQLIEKARKRRLQNCFEMSTLYLGSVESLLYCCLSFALFMRV